MSNLGKRWKQSGRRALKRDGNPEFESQFWSHVDKSGDCWIWTGSKHDQGYGQINIDKKMTFTHRISYEISNNVKLDRNTKVLHSCDNPPCVNPAHLFLGTQADNVRDAVAKGRMKTSRGCDHKLSKLSYEDIVMIRKLHFEGMSGADLGRMYHVGKSTVHRIIKKYTYKGIN
jgi:hypothetical protein